MRAVPVFKTFIQVLPFAWNQLSGPEMLTIISFLKLSRMTYFALQLFIDT